MAKQKKAVAEITVEWDDDLQENKNLKVEDGKLDKTKMLYSQSGDDDFQPNRIIADLKVSKGDGKKTVELKNVRFKARSSQKPRLAWWNGAKWVEFTQVTYDAAASVADVILPSPWPTDPAIGIWP